MISTFVPQDICLAFAFYKGVVDVKSIAPQNAGPGTSRANPNNIEILRRALTQRVLCCLSLHSRRPQTPSYAFINLSLGDASASLSFGLVQKTTI